jgi:hypothetical protein
MVESCFLADPLNLSGPRRLADGQPGNERLEPNPSLLLEALLGHIYVNFIVNSPDVDPLNCSSLSF